MTKEQIMALITERLNLVKRETEFSIRNNMPNNYMNDVIHNQTQVLIKTFDMIMCEDYFK